MAVMTYAEAASRALAEEMRRDPSVIVLGEDVRFGGVSGQYKGLVEEFGPDRVVDTPIAEATIMGAGLGAALVGLRPVIEMRIADFVMPAMDELVNQIAKVRYMFGGQARARVVVRMPHGVLPGSAAQHNQIIENWFVNLPGVVVMTPADATDVVGMLKAAVRSDDPVVLFEPKAYWKQSEEIATSIDPTPIGKGLVRREGHDLTLVCWSHAVRPALAAAMEAEARGTSVEVIDLRSLWPWDRAMVAASVKKTGRLLVVQEGGVDGGFGGEIVASMVELLGPAALKAVRRLGAPRIPSPFSPPLEQAVTLTQAKIARAIDQILA